MTDKELLELAAKSAGLMNPRFVENTSLGTGISYGEGDDIYHVWNPLTDDGDALRLAVKLGVIVDLRYSRRTNGWPVEVCYWRKGEEGSNAKKATEYLHDGDDPYAAIRRAIVRAAAEIGKNHENT